MEESLSHLPVSSLQKLVAHAAASNAEAPRIDFLAKHIFVNDFDKIENMSKAIKLCDTAIRTITVIKFYEKKLHDEMRTLVVGGLQGQVRTGAYILHPHGTKS